MRKENHLIKNGRYSIIQTSTKSEIGECYKAFDNELNKNVLLKEFEEVNLNTCKTYPSESFQNDFKLKAEKLCKLNHKSLFNVEGYFSDFNHNYLVIENIIGASITKVIENDKKPCPLKTFLNFADKLLNVAGFLHSQSPLINHKEITPQNIYLSEDGGLKLSSLNIIQYFDKQENFVSKDELFDSKKIIF